MKLNDIHLKTVLHKSQSFFFLSGKTENHYINKSALLFSPTPAIELFYELGREKMLLSDSGNSSINKLSMDRWMDR